MPGTLYQRLYDRLTTLIPQLCSPCVGMSFYASPRIAGDIASYCTVTRVDAGVCEVEIAQDVMINGKPQPAPWMVFRIDLSVCTAELLAIEDLWRYEVVYSDDDTPNPRRGQINQFAFNCLTALLTLGGVFCPVDMPMVIEA